MIFTIGARGCPTFCRWRSISGFRNFSTSMGRYSSASDKLSVPEAPKLDFIPEKPVAIVSDSVSALTKPTFHSLGLASWWPSGRLQFFMENVHMGLDVPWWGTIFATTALIRVAVFPLVIYSQKNAARLNQCMPEMTHIQTRLSDARKRGDIIEVQKWSVELSAFIKEKNVQPLKNFIPIFFQVPIFMSMFFALRGMSNLPVESMAEGGLSWFQDLTVSDPYYILPVIVSASFFLQLYFAVDGANFQSMGPIGKGVCKAVPFIMFPLIMNFPSAMTFYWTTTNVISVVQVKFIRNSRVRRLFGIPEFKDWSKLKTEKFKKKNQGFREAVKEAMDNWKVQSDVADRRSFDEQSFREAGIKKKRKTYKFNPTAPMLSSKENR